MKEKGSRHLTGSAQPDGAEVCHKLLCGFTLLAASLAFTGDGAAEETESDGEPVTRLTPTERVEIDRVLKATRIDAVITKPEAREAMRSRGGPVMLYRGAPVYPKEQGRKGVQGCVLVAFDIRPDGKTDEFEVMRSEPPGVFDDLVVRSIYATEFEPLKEKFRAYCVFNFFIGQPVVREHSKLNPLLDAKRERAQANLKKICDPRSLSNVEAPSS